MAKGSQFERDICKELSRWWTDGKDDSIFWRTSNSGGRATSRRKRGKSTRAHCGDIAAVDSAGRALTELVTFELKRGYSKKGQARGDFFDLVDRPKYLKNVLFEQWILQATTAAANAGTPYWAVIQRRDARQAVIFVPYDLFAAFVGCSVVPYLDFDGKVGTERMQICCTRLTTFLRHVLPADVRTIWKNRRKNASS